jgi:DNA-directed RNA polymerase subunit RPC12/RpoP
MMFSGFRLGVPAIGSNESIESGMPRRLHLPPLTKLLGLAILLEFVNHRVIKVRNMEIRFLCPSCGRKLKADEEAAGRKVECPDCGMEFRVPQPEISLPPTKPEPSVEPARDPGFANPNPDGELTCPVCWLRFDAGDIMHIAVHDSLRGDPLLGEDAQQRFLATRFNNAGQALDAMSLPSSEIACPHCRRKLPPSFLGMPHHIISLVGDQSAGKSYFLSVLTKVLPATLYREFGIVFQDSDPTGNAPVNDMRKALFGAQSPAQAKLAKTVFEGAMYERLPRQGRMVALPRPFVYTLAAEEKIRDQCALIFYDNAGEHFQPGVNIVEQPGAQHVASAAGIMFLFDPFNSPEFRQILRDTKDPQFEKPVVDQQDIILSEMRTRIQTIRNLRPGETIQTPVAFIVGKSDVWLHLLNGKPLRDFIQDGKLDIAAIEENSSIVRELLYRICPPLIANAEALSSNVTFFAASSFGHTPTKIGPGEYVPDPSKLQPVNVEVPLLWILSQVCPNLFAAGDASAPKLCQ